MSIELKIPSLGESIQEVQIGQWLKREGDHVKHDETIVELETDKASMELPAPSDGVISKIVKHDGDSVRIGDVIAYLEPAGQGKSEGEKASTEKSPSASAQAAVASSPETTGPVKLPYEVPAAKPAQPAETANVERSLETPAAAPSVRRLLREHHLQAADLQPQSEGGRLLRDDVLNYVDEHPQGPATKEMADRAPDEKQGAERTSRPLEGRLAHVEPSSSLPARSAARVDQNLEETPERIVPMSLIRRRIAERLVEARQKAALLTTFNEIDMSAVMELRASLREPFQQKYGVKLGILSFFVKTAVEALWEIPAVNAEVRGTDIVYRDAYHIGIAIGATRGLVVPVLRYADRLSFAEIEQAIDDFAVRAESNKLEPGELSGGTFTITNGGIFGSLLSTPIVNAPQSGVLGLHAIQQRPVAREGQVVIRPMMYVALTYDHRIIDGREAVTFLRRIKEMMESPARLFVGV